MEEYMALYDEERKAWMQAAYTRPLGNFFEDIINAIYSAILKPGDLAVDCGANCGVHTFPMSKLVGSSGRVVAVEAIPDLAAGLAQRGFPNIDVKATAIGAAAGRASFSVVRDDIGYSGLRQRHDLPGDLAGRVDVIDVPVATLDSLLADRRQRVRFVKMDLEGGEFHALQGATSILRDRPLVILENARESAANLYGYTSEDWFSLFDTADFAVFDLFGRPFCRNDWHASGMPWYVIAAPRGSADERFVQRRAPGQVRRLYWKKTFRRWLRPRTRIRAAINPIRR
jgi:FkbM family methyltransferase